MAKHVKTRNANGADLHYVEGWHVIAEANRIFGYDAWDRRTLASHCVWSGAIRRLSRRSLHRQGAGQRPSRRHYDCAGGVRDGRRQGPYPGASTRACARKAPRPTPPSGRLPPLATPSGLPSMTESRLACASRADEFHRSSAPLGPWVLHSPAGAQEASFDKPSEFAAALRKSMSEARDIEILFAIWEQNVDTVRALNKHLKQDHLPNSGVAPQLVAHLKRCAIALVKPHAAGTEEVQATSSQALNGGGRQKIDKSVLTISEPKRHRSKEHLQYVAQQPCLICGRSPSHAHHVRFAQSKGLALKVSDEFTVPLCAIHHSENHSTGDERKWWQKHNIEPLAIARRLWEESCKRGEHTAPDQGIRVSPPYRPKAAKC